METVLCCATDLSSMDESRSTVDLHPSDPDQSDQSVRSDHSVGLRMEQMELSSGEVVEQPPAMRQSPADEAMDQCMFCAACSNIITACVATTLSFV